MANEKIKPGDLLRKKREELQKKTVTDDKRKRVQDMFIKSMNAPVFTMEGIIPGFESGTEMIKKIQERERTDLTEDPTEKVKKLAITGELPGVVQKDRDQKIIAEEKSKEIAGTINRQRQNILRTFEREAQTETGRNLNEQQKAGILGFVPWLDETPAEQLDKKVQSDARREYLKRMFFKEQGIEPTEIEKRIADDPKLDELTAGQQIINERKEAEKEVIPGITEVYNDLVQNKPKDALDKMLKGGYLRTRALGRGFMDIPVGVVKAVTFLADPRFNMTKRAIDFGADKLTGLLGLKGRNTEFEEKYTGFLDKSRDILTEYVDKIGPDMQKYQNDYFTKMSTGAGSVIGFMLTTALTRGMNLAPNVAAGLMGLLSQAGSMADDTYRRTGDIDKAYMSFLAGIPLGYSEALGLGRMLGNLDKLTGNSVKRVIAEGLKEGVEETLQEGFQSFGEAYADNLITGADRDPLKEALENITVAGPLGFIFPFGVGGISKIYNKIKGQNKQLNTMPEPPMVDEKGKEIEPVEVEIDNEITPDDIQGLNEAMDELGVGEKLVKGDKSRVKSEKPKPVEQQRNRETKEEIDLKYYQDNSYVREQKSIIDPNKFDVVVPMPYGGNEILGQVDDINIDVKKYATEYFNKHNNKKGKSTSNIRPLPTGQEGVTQKPVKPAVKEEKEGKKPGKVVTNDVTKTENGEGKKPDYFVINKGEDLLKDLEAIQNGERRRALSEKEETDTYDWLNKFKNKLTTAQQERLNKLNEEKGTNAKDKEKITDKTGVKSNTEIEKAIEDEAKRRIKEREKGGFNNEKYTLELAKTETAKIVDKVKELIDEKDYGKLRDWMHQGNKFMKKAFGLLTGVKLPSTDRDTLKVLREFTGEDSYNKYLEREKNRDKELAEKDKERNKTYIIQAVLNKKYKATLGTETAKDFLDRVMAKGFDKIVEKKSGFSVKYRLSNKEGEMYNISADEKRYVEMVLGEKKDKPEKPKGTATADEPETKKISYADAQKLIAKEGGYANASSFEAVNAISASQIAGSFSLNAKYLYDKAQEKGINLREWLLKIDSDAKTRIDQAMKLMDELGMDKEVKDRAEKNAKDREEREKTQDEEKGKYRNRPDVPNGEWAEWTDVNGIKRGRLDLGYKQPYYEYKIKNGKLTANKIEINPETGGGNITQSWEDFKDLDQLKETLSGDIKKEQDRINKQEQEEKEKLSKKEKDVKAFFEGVLPKKLPAKSDLFDGYNVPAGYYKIQPINQKVTKTDDILKNLGRNISEDDLRPNIQGVYFDKKNQVATATDGHQIVVIPTKVKETKLVDPSDGSLIEDEFPNYQAILPEPEQLQAHGEFDLQELYNQVFGIERARKFVDYYAPVVFAIEIKDAEKSVYFDPIPLKKGLAALLRSGTTRVKYETWGNQTLKGVKFSDVNEPGKFAFVMPVRDIGDMRKVLLKTDESAKGNVRNAVEEEGSKTPSLPTAGLPLGKGETKSQPETKGKFAQKLTEIEKESAELEKTAGASIAFTGTAKKSAWNKLQSYREKKVKLAERTIALRTAVKVENGEYFTYEDLQRLDDEGIVDFNNPVPFVKLAELVRKELSKVDKTFAKNSNIRIKYPQNEQIWSSKDNKVEVIAKTQKETKTKPASEIEDFGEKIGGARKDMFAGRGLDISDLDKMNEREQYELVIKDNVWPKPDYTKMIENGLNVNVAYALKQIKDAIPTRPSSNSKQHIQDYITAVKKVREAFENVKELKDIEGNTFFKQVFGNGYDFETRTWNDAGRDIYRQLSSKVVQKMQVRAYDMTKIIRKVKETGWPGKMELWRKNIKIFKDDKSGKYIIAKGYRILEDGFESEESAEKHLVDVIKPQILKQNEKTRTGFVRPQLAYIKREGEDFRKGRNVTEKDFSDTFGFRGGEFGNWQNQADRQANLNMAYDALMDLAKVLNIPPKAISLNGELAIGFGSRGTGGKRAAMAHYETARVVINLTKMSGAGSLAHEWAHALDDYFGRQSKDKTVTNPFVTSGVSKQSALRPEIQAAFDKIMDKILRKVKSQQEMIDETMGREKMLKDAMKRQVKQIRTDMTRGGVDYKNNAIPVANEEQLARFDALAETVIEGKGGATELDGMYSLYKGLFGRLPVKDIRDYLGHAVKTKIFIANRLEKIYKKEIEEKGPTEYIKAAKKLDSGRTKPYYTLEHELFARAFESYVFDQIRDNGRSDYLVHSVTNELYDELNPYPGEPERGSINAAIAQLFEAIKTEERGDNVVMFMKNRETSDVKRQTESEEFKAWFGDSKVVDADGKPLVVYHYTSADVDFSKFKKRGNDIGIHFGTDGQANDRFEFKNKFGDKINQRIFPVYLKINKPLRLADVGWFDAENVEFGLSDLANFTSDELKRARNRQYPSNWLKNLRELIKSKGYDGIIYRNTGEVTGSSEFERKRYDNNLTEEERVKAQKEYDKYIEKNAEDSYIVFNPNQIKSATGNRGTFDAGNPDIRYLKGEDDLFNVDGNLGGKRAEIKKKFGDISKFEKPKQELVKVWTGEINETTIRSKNGNFKFVKGDNNYGAEKIIRRHFGIHLNTRDLLRLPLVLDKGKMSTTYNNRYKIEYWDPKDRLRYQVIVTDDNLILNYFSNFENKKTRQESHNGQNTRFKKSPGSHNASTGNSISSNITDRKADVKRKAYVEKIRATVSRLEAAIPGVKVNYVDNAGMIDLQRKYGNQDKTAHYAFALVNKKEVYINLENANTEAPLHEYGHIFGQMIRNEKPGLWQDGVKIIRQAADAVDFVKRSYPGLEGDMLYDEVLMQAVGGKLDEVLAGNEKLYNRLQAWIKRFWEKVKQVLSDKLGVRGLNKARLQVEKLDFETATLDDFARAIAGDLLAGNEIVFEQDVRDAMDELGLVKSPASFGGTPFSKGDFVEPFYSQLERVAEAKVSNNASPEQVMKTLLNNGVKKEEIEWMGLGEWLSSEAGKSENQKIDKAKLMDFIAQNKVVIEEKVLGEGVITEIPEGLIFERDGKWRRRGAYDPKTFWKTKEEAEKAYLESINNRYNPPKYQQYQLPGGENYREILFKLPINNKQLTIEIKQKGGNYRTKEPYFTVYVDDTIYEAGLTKEEAELLKEDLQSGAKKLRAGFKNDEFISSHFGGEKNIIAHTRINDRTLPDGKKMLFIEEVQSDWHQKGRKQGYRDEKIVKKYIVIKDKIEKAFLTAIDNINIDEIDFKYNGPDNPSMFLYQDGGYGRTYGNTRTEALESAKQKIARMDPEYRKYLDQKIEIESQLGEIPDAPFKKSWHELVMKRMIRYAAENGYDAVGWTTGEQQNERYDLSKQVDSVSYETMSNAKAEMPKSYNILVKPKGETGYKNLGTFEESKLSDVVGKELAEKIVNGEGVENSDGLLSFTGVDLKIGGEGMKGFYDRMIPSFVNKYVRKWQVPGSKLQVEEGKINTLASIKKEDTIVRLKDGDYRLYQKETLGTQLLSAISKESTEGMTPDEIHSELIDRANTDDDQKQKTTTKIHQLRLTPEMKESVLYSGQAMFMKGQGKGKSEKAKIIYHYGSGKELVNRPEGTWFTDNPVGVIRAKGYSGKVEKTINPDNLNLATYKEFNPLWQLTPKEKVNTLKAKGYDGVRLKVDSDTHYLIFDVDKLSDTDKSGGAINQTDTPEFQKWFGDSKVVDADGKPLVVYHGTDADFNKFKRVNPSKDIGMHFGTLGQATEIIKNIEGMDERAVNQNLMPVYLSIKNPLRLKDLGSWNPLSVAQGIRQDSSVNSLLKNDILELMQKGSFNQVQQNKGIREILKKYGYDGIVYKNTEEIPGRADLRRDRWKPGISKSEQIKNRNKELKMMANESIMQDSYIVFEPSQIKSATGNRGTFDAGNPDIRFMKGDPPQPPLGKGGSTTPGGIYVRKNKTISDKVFDANLDKLGKIGAKVLMDERTKTPRGTERETGEATPRSGEAGTPPFGKGGTVTDKSEFKKKINETFGNSTKKPFVLSEEQSDKLYEASVRLLNELERAKVNKEREFEKRTAKTIGARISRADAKATGWVNNVLNWAQLKPLEEMYRKAIGQKVFDKSAELLLSNKYVAKFFEQFADVPDREKFKKLWKEMEGQTREYKELAKDIANSLYYRDFKTKAAYTLVEQRLMETMIRGNMPADGKVTIAPNEKNGLAEPLVIDMRDLKDRVKRVKQLFTEMKKLGELYEVLPIETYNSKLPRKRIAWLLKFKGELEMLKQVAGDRLQVAGDETATGAKAPSQKGMKDGPAVGGTARQHGALSLEWMDAKGNVTVLKFRNAEEIQERIDSTDKMIKNNYKKGGEGYFKRVYVSKELEKTLSKYGIIKPTKLDLTSAIHREDIPLDVRVKMGEVLTAAYPTAKSIVLEGKDISIGRFFETISENPVWSSHNPTEGWAQVPDSKKYGKLRNMWVHPEVWEQLNDMIKYNDPGYADNFVKQFTSTWKAVRVPMNPPTVSRNVITNFVMLDYSGTSINQSLTHLPQALREMRNYGKNGKNTPDERFDSAQRDKVGKGGSEASYAHIVSEFKSTSFSAQEMLKFLDDYDKLGIDKPGFMDLSLADKILHIYRKGTLVDTSIGRGALGFYQGTEVVFKMVKFLDEKSKGKTDEEAINEANKWLFDYSEIPSWMKKYRESLFGAPFVTWSYKALPRVIEAAVTRPISFAKYPVLFYAITSAAINALGMTDDEWEQIKKDMPDRMKNGQWLLIPFRDSKGQIQMLDLTFIMPYSDIYTMGLTAWTLATEGTYPTGATVAEGLGNMLGNPIMSMSIELTTNYSRYTRREIWGDADTPAEKYQKMADYMYKMWMPSWAPETNVLFRAAMSPVGGTLIPDNPWLNLSRGGYVWDKLRSAVTDRPDYYNRLFDMGPAIGSSIFGLKTTPIDPDKLVDDNIKQREGKILDLQQKKGQVIKDDSIPQELRLKKSAEIDEEIDKLKKEIKGYEERSVPSTPEALLLDRMIRSLQRTAGDDPQKKAEINRLKIDLDILKQEKYNKDQPGLEDVKKRVLKSFNYDKVLPVIKSEIEKELDETPPQPLPEGEGRIKSPVIERNRELLAFLSKNENVPADKRKEFEQMHKDFDKMVNFKKEINRINDIIEKSGITNADGKAYSYNPAEYEKLGYSVELKRAIVLLEGGYMPEKRYKDEKGRSKTSERRKVAGMMGQVDKDYKDGKITAEERKLKKEGIKKAVEELRGK